MFSFLDMEGTYEERKVDQFKDTKTGLIIDTCLVTDSDQPYETGIRHPAFNNGYWIIVELYNNKAEAQIGHAKWIETMTKNELPDSLTDVSTAKIKVLLNAINKENESSTYPCIEKRGIKCQK